MVGQHPDGFQLLVAQQVCLVQDEDGGSASLVAFCGQGCAGLGDQSRGQVRRGGAERGDDGLVDAADADHRVGQVDDGVAGGVQAGQDGADRDGFPGADFSGDHADGAFGDAPADAGDGFVVGGVPVQHARGKITSEGHAGEPKM